MGSLPAFQAIVPSTKYSGIVCTMATIAKARPRLIDDSAASAAHAMRREAAITAPKVEMATAYSRLGTRKTTRNEPIVQTKRAVYSKNCLVFVAVSVPLYDAGYLGI